MEEWRDIQDYKNSYKISSLGKIKSLKRNKEVILKPSINKAGYYQISLYSNKRTRTYKVHQLVAIAFLNHIRNGMTLVVNHINFNRLDNNIKNLEIVTARCNTNKKHLISSSIYTGVHWNKKDKRWFSQIRVNGELKAIHLGSFKEEIDAHNAYQLKLEEIK